MTAREGGGKPADQRGGDPETQGAMCWPNPSGSLPVGQRGPAWPRWGHHQWCHRRIWGYATLLEYNKAQTNQNSIS